MDTLPIYFNISIHTIEEVRNTNPERFDALLKLEKEIFEHREETDGTDK